MELSRRGFIELGGTVAMLGHPGNLAQVDSPGTEEEDFDVYGLILDTNRPSKALLDEKWDTYRFVHLDPSSGEKAWITHDVAGWNEVASMIPTNQLGKAVTAESDNFFDHTFARPEAPDTKNWDFTDADITKQNNEVELASTTVLETTQRGNYAPGGEATPGLAFRITDVPTGGEAHAGYINGTDGLRVGEDTTDSFVEIQKGGTTKRVYRTDWNGFVPNQRVWVDNRPLITQMPHLFYGGGDLNVKVLLHAEAGSEFKTLHTFTANNVNDTFSDGATIDQPNLPVKFESNNLSGASLRANAAHYQFEFRHGETRENGETFDGIDATDTGWTPLIAWRTRAGWDVVNVEPHKLNVFAATNDARLDVQLNPTLSGGTWDTPTNTSSSETAVEVSTDITLDATGERRWVGYAPAGQGGAQGPSETSDLTFNIAADREVVVAAQGVGGTSTVSGVVEWEEFF